jgi:hypothetical protein
MLPAHSSVLDLDRKAFYQASGLCIMNPKYQSQQVGDDTNDAAQPAPAQRLDTTTLNQIPKANVADLLAPQAGHRHQLLASVLGMPGVPLGAADRRSSHSSSRRPVSPQETGLNPPPLAKAIAAWSASPQSGQADIRRSKTPSPVQLSRAGPSGMALSFFKNIVQEKAAVTVNDNLVQGLRRDMRDEL